MITIKSFTFNIFAINTMVLSDETGECIIIDPGCSKPYEQKQLTDYIDSNSFKLKAQIITHYHIDHALGAKFIKEKYNVGATAHPGGRIFWENTESRGYEYGLNTKDIIPPDHFINENDKVKFGNSEFDVLYTPGHAEGSICLVNHAQKFVIAGDVLFNGSIGRTDLPTGDLDVLRESIIQKLFSLDDNYTVYPGHGEKTIIGMERLHNPFLN